jgi:glycerol-3-phosphate dehydrogenase
VKVPKDRWNELDGLKTEDLQAVFKYKDGATDDAALTRAVMASAKSLGVELAMPAEFLSAKSHEDHNIIEYSINGINHTCSTKLLVNAAGPWANLVLDKISPKPSKLEFDLIAGTHIIVDTPSPEGMYYVEAPQDGRAVFVMPWKGKTMIGTTETKFTGDPSEVIALENEIEYLCEIARAYFPKLKDLTRDNIYGSFAGLRVLPHAIGRAFSRPRETTFHIDKAVAPRVATIYGGKLTAYRITAENFVNKMKGILPNRKRKTCTRELHLNSVKP